MQARHTLAGCGRSTLLQGARVSLTPVSRSGEGGSPWGRFMWGPGWSAARGWRAARVRRLTPASGPSHPRPWSVCLGYVGRSRARAPTVLVRTGIVRRSQDTHSVAPRVDVGAYTLALATLRASQRIGLPLRAGSAVRGLVARLPCVPRPAGLEELCRASRALRPGVLRFVLSESGEARSFYHVERAGTEKVTFILRPRRVVRDCIALRRKVAGSVPG